MDFLGVFEFRGAPTCSSLLGARGQLLLGLGDNTQS
jgi:hypothetical protein